MTSRFYATQVSQHARARCRQRGLTAEDVALVMEFGESVDDGYVMTRKVLQSAQTELHMQNRKRQIQLLDHLKGIAVIEAGHQIITAYRADKKRIRRLRKGPVKVLISSRRPAPNLYFIRETKHEA